MHWLVDCFVVMLQYLLCCDYIEFINAMTDNRWMLVGPVGDMGVERRVVHITDK